MNLWVRRDTVALGESITTLFQCSSSNNLPSFFSPSVHNPSLQPSLFFTTNPGYIRLPKLLFSSGTQCCVRKLWEQEGWASTLPMAIPGMHPLCGSGPQPTMWPPNVTAALRQKRDWVFFPCKKTKGCILLPYWQYMLRLSNTARLPACLAAL